MSDRADSGSPHQMRLRIVTPVAIVLDVETDHITAEDLDGSFTLLPRHIDMASALSQGLVAYRSEGVEHLVAVDGGTLIKCGPIVEIATRAAISGDSILDLEHEVRDTFQELGESERRARSAIARLEGDVNRRLMEMDGRD